MISCWNYSLNMQALSVPLKHIYSSTILQSLNAWSGNCDAYRKRALSAASAWSEARLLGFSFLKSRAYSAASAWSEARLLGFSFLKSRAYTKALLFVCLMLKHKKSDKKALCVNGCFSRSGHNLKGQSMFYFLWLILKPSTLYILDF